MSLNPDFIHELRKRFAGEIRTDLVSRNLYSTDESIYQIEPQGVVIPRNQDELQSAVELAAKFRIPVLPCRAGTSLAGQAIGDALILDCSRWLDSILEIEADLRHVENLGGTIVTPKTEIPGTGWFGVFQNPTGNKIALYTSQNPSFN